jgi:hypothetical protein
VSNASKCLVEEMCACERMYKNMLWVSITIMATGGRERESPRTGRETDAKRGASTAMCDGRLPMPAERDHASPSVAAVMAEDSPDGVYAAGAGASGSSLTVRRSGLTER